MQSSPAATFRLAARGFSRSFSTTPRWQIRTVDMEEVDLKALKVNQRRLMDTLHRTSEFGKGQRWGQ